MLNWTISSAVYCEWHLTSQALQTLTHAIIIFLQIIGRLFHKIPPFSWVKRYSWRALRTLIFFKAVLSWSFPWVFLLPFFWILLPRAVLTKHSFGTFASDDWLWLTLNDLSSVIFLFAVFRQYTSFHDFLFLPCLGHASSTACFCAALFQQIGEGLSIFPLISLPIFWAEL